MPLKRIVALAFALLITLVTFVASAQQAAGDPAARIAAARRSVIALQETADSGVITRGQAEEGAKRYIAQASEAAGKTLTLDELMSAPDAVTAGPVPQLTALQRFAGLVTFVNVLWVLAIGVGVASFAFLFGSFVKDLIKALKNVPLEFYEFTFYAGSVGLAVYGRTLSEGVAPYVGLTGCLLFGAALLFTAKAHKALKLGGAGVSAVLFAAWSAAAFVYGSSMLGFIAVAAFLSALGFSVIVSPLCYCIGFKDDAALGKATSAAFVILAGAVGIRIAKAHVPALATFEDGALFLGSFVGYLGLLIASSRWYDGKDRNYVLFQVVTVVAGIAALFVGSVFGIGELQKIGGTFFVLYLTEKMFEIPAKSARGYAAVGLVVSAAIFGFSMYVKSNPESLRPFLFMPH